MTVLTRFNALPFQTDEQLSLNMLALVAWWIGGFILCFGTRAFRCALFPLCFLLWIVPIPQFLLNPIIKLLQEGSVKSAHLLLAAVGSAGRGGWNPIDDPRFDDRSCP